MARLWRVMFVGVLVVAGLGGCRGNRMARVCPEGTELVADRSAEGKQAWCKSKDGQTWRYVELHPGTSQPRQSCGYAGGKPEGGFTAWHPNGKMWISGDYRAGEKAGKWTQWDKDGFKVAEGEYRTGRFVAGAPVGIAATCEKNTP